LPLFFIPGTDQYAIAIGSGFTGHLLGFALFVIWVMALAVTFTWVFNNTRGSLLLVMLLHASINTAPYVILPRLFPSLAGFGLSWILVWVVVALLLLVITRSRLSYARFTAQNGALGQDSPPEEVNPRVTPVGR
jgi:hypothetical protein